MWLVYELILFATSLLILPFYLFRPKYLANLRERLGSYKTERAAHDLWIHAVSVGETLAAKTIVAEIVRLRPQTSIVFTTTTITGQEQARNSFPFATVTYFPFDFAFSVRRFLDHHQPRVFATMETEIWPNVTRLARARGLKLILANGRISDRSFPRYRMLRAIIGPILHRYDRILAREEVDRDRFIAIGAPPEIVETSGNVKFDYTPDATPLTIAPQLRALIADRPVLMLASLREGEHELLLPQLDAFLREHNAFAIVAPRKPDQFDHVANVLSGVVAGGLARRSSLTDLPSSTLLLDSVGELARIYDFATVAFVGGSLVATGGHNPIEAAAAGVPVCFGPHMTNFREIASVLLRDGGAVEVASPSDVFAFAARMIDDASQRTAMGERGRKSIEQNRGASLRTAQRIIELL